MDLDALQRQAEADGRRCVVAALIVDGRGRAFVHRRGPQRAFLPGAWDLVGGHVDPGESLLDALAREVTEETGWRLGGSPTLAFVGDWLERTDDPSSARREFDFVVKVEGNLARPRLEWPQHVEFRWLEPTEIGLLDENRGRDEGLVRHLVELAFRSANVRTLAHPHAGIFLPPTVAAPIEALRARWDPALAGQIGAHVTVAYPDEAAGLDDLRARARAAAGRVGPFALRLGAPAMRREGRHAWVGVQVEDPEGGWRRLRELLVGERGQDVQPHVTIVHPRHSNLGLDAWRRLEGQPFDAGFTAAELAITAFDGRVWRTVEELSLAGDG